MTQAEFNKGVLNALLSIIVELDLRSDVGDNSCASLFVQVRELGRAMEYDLEMEVLSARLAKEVEK